MNPLRIFNFALLKSGGKSFRLGFTSTGRPANLQPRREESSLHREEKGQEVGNINKPHELKKAMPRVWGAKESQGKQAGQTVCVLGPTLGLQPDPAPPGGWEAAPPSPSPLASAAVTKRRSWSTIGGELGHRAAGETARSCKLFLI